MVIRIETDPEREDEEIVIRCREIGESIRRLHAALLDAVSAPPSMVFYKGDEAFYFPLADVLFFETGGDNVYAHTADDAFRVDLRLYELERLLPSPFMRVSKSTLLNTDHVYSIQRNIAASSPVQFRASHKKVYVSRLYYKLLRQKMDERGQRK